MTRTEKLTLRIALLLMLSGGCFIMYSRRPKTEDAVIREYTTSKVQWTDRQGKACTKTAWNILRQEFSETASAAIIGNMIYAGTLEPYDEAETEETVRAIMDGYLMGYAESAARINLYDTDEISMAVEDFRLCFGTGSGRDYARQKRTDYAKQIYAGYCEDIYTIEAVSTAPYDFDITEKVKILNKELGI